MYYNVTEKVRRVMESYFRLDTPLYFSYSHLVCRTAIEGGSHRACSFWGVGCAVGLYQRGEDSVRVLHANWDIRASVLAAAQHVECGSSIQEVNHPGVREPPSRVVRTLQDKCVCGAEGSKKPCKPKRPVVKE